MKKEIFLVTSNARKVEDYNRRIDNGEYIVKNVALDLNEGRSMDILEIAKLKLLQAKELFPGKRIIVEDRGFFIPALNGFPGPFVKLFLNTIGIDGLLKLMAGEDNREASLITVLGYYDGQDDHFFYDDEKGFITKEKRGDNIRGWTDILYIYGYQTFPGLSMAELNDEQWAEHIRITESCDFIEKFKMFLEGC